MPRWLPGQLPLALLVAAGEASIVLWLGWRRAWGATGVALAAPGGVSGQAWCAGAPPGIASALSGGRTLTADGCALGLQTSTGELAGFSWAAAENGVLLTGRPSS